MCFYSQKRITFRALLQLYPVLLIRMIKLAIYAISHDLRYVQLAVHRMWQEHEQ